MDFVIDEPCLRIGRTLVVAEIHIGLEKQLESAGFHLPNQTDAMIGKLRGLMAKTNTRELAVIGDLKHSISKIGQEEKEKLRHFAEEMSRGASLVLVKGNHDGAIEHYLDIPVYDEYAIGKTLLVHGHKNLENIGAYERVVMGHSHPSVTFRDKFGGAISERVWLIHRGAPEIIVVPPFNPLIGGSDVRHGLLGPVAKNINLGEADLYLLNGLYLGKVRELSASEADNRDKEGPSAVKRKDVGTGRARVLGRVQAGAEAGRKKGKAVGQRGLQKGRRIRRKP